MCTSSLGVVAFGKAFASIFQKIDYRITIIEDERVPLAPSGEEYFGIAVIGMLIILTILLIAIYFYYNIMCRKRIRELGGTPDTYYGWQLGRLKETITELELQKTGYFLEEIEKNGKNIEPFGNIRESY